MQLAGDVPWDDNQEADEEDVVEGVSSRGVGRERAIFDGRVLEAR
jgi:hypothetical protein